MLVRRHAEGPADHEPVGGVLQVILKIIPASEVHRPGHVGSGVSDHVANLIEHIHEPDVPRGQWQFEQKGARLCLSGLAWRRGFAQGQIEQSEIAFDFAGDRVGPLRHPSRGAAGRIGSRGEAERHRDRDARKARDEAEADQPGQCGAEGRRTHFVQFPGGPGNRTKKS